VVIGLASIKFSGSSRIFGLKVMSISRIVMDIVNPSISFRVK